MPECLVANLFQPPLMLECLVHDFIKIQTLFCLKQKLLHLEDSLVALSTSQTLVQISLLLFKFSANMFYTLHQLTSKLVFASYDISKMLSIFPYFLLPVKFNWRHSVTLIGWVTLTPQVHNYFLCLFRLFSYSLKSKKQATVSKSSYEAKYQALTSVACELQWLTYLLIYVYLPSKPYPFVIIVQHSILLSTLCFMSAQSTWKLTATLYARDYFQARSSFFLFFQPINLLTYSPKLYLLMLFIFYSSS